MSIQPVQIIGTQRSGSNMLRLMLNQISSITAPHPPHILQRFFPLLHTYGNLENYSNMSRLIDDVCSLIELNPVPWHILLDRIQIQNLCKENSLFEIFRVVYNLKAIEEDAKYWVCKSMTNMKYSVELENFEQKPLYIHLIRDGRDVACSLQKTIVGEKHIYNLANFWKREQQACIDLKDSVGDARVIQVRYESLIHEPEIELNRISRFLGVDFTPDVFDFYKSSDSKETAQAGKMWENLTKPIISGNSNKYKKQLVAKDIILFEHIAGDMLLRMNYNLNYPQARKELKLNSEAIRNFNQENDYLKEVALMSADKKDLDKRFSQTKLIERIADRAVNVKELNMRQDNYLRKAIV